jgi:hypothetical protein
VLRAKYLDWCSARVAERFVKLTPEEIYELAQRATPGAMAQQGEPAGALPDRSVALSARSAASEGVPGATDAAAYNEIVERVTRALTSELGLPPFEEWARAYRASPGQYDEELLGFWREQL